MIRIIVPHREIQSQSHIEQSVIRKYGLNPYHLVQYSFAVDQIHGFQDLARHLEKDILEVFPDMRRHAMEYQTLLHHCITYVFELSQHVLNIIRFYLKSDAVSLHDLRFDGFIGDDMSILMID